MTEIASEDDLWKLFWEKPPRSGHRQKGEQFVYGDTLMTLLDAKSFGANGKNKLALTDETRRYLVAHDSAQAFVRQCDLRAVIKALARDHAGNVHVGYLGQSEADPARLTPAPESVPQRQKALTAQKALPDAKKFPQDDTLGKIVESYFAALTAEPFSYGGKEYLPRELYVSPGIVRGYTCPAMCGGCCPRFSLDYIAPDGVPEGEKHPLTMRVVAFNGRQVEVWSDMQKDHKDLKCRNLNLGTGLCNIHGFQPFSCDFELLRSIMKQRVEFTQKLYGRGHDMMRVDGIRGALCEMTPSTPEKVADVDRRLARLETWMTHFGLNPKRVAHIRANLGWIAETGKPLNIPKDTLLA